MENAPLRAAEERMEELFAAAHPDRPSKDLEAIVENHFRQARKNAGLGAGQEIAQRRMLATLAERIAGEAGNVANHGIAPWEQAMYACAKTAGKLYGKPGEVCFNDPWCDVANGLVGKTGKEFDDFAHAGFGLSLNDFNSVATPEIVALATAVAARAYVRWYGGSVRQAARTIGRRVNDNLSPDQTAPF